MRGLGVGRGSKEVGSLMMRVITSSTPKTARMIGVTVSANKGVIGKGVVRNLSV